jgi:hypothetical protein
MALTCLSGCAVPLAPGYSIQKQSLTVHFVPGSPPHLAIRAEYRLANVGNAPLDSIEVGLPDHRGFGRENLRVQVQGREVSPAIVRGADADEGESSSSHAWPVVWRIPFSPAWPRKQKRNLLITYDLTAASEPRGRMYLSPTVFYLNDSGWFPDLLAPKSFLAKDLIRPNPSELDIIVPQNFLAHGSGELRGVKKSSAETEYCFRIRKEDFDPFVIAGQYHEQHVTASDGAVVFWTFKPLPSAEAQQTAARIATAAKFYSETYGLLPRSMKSIYDVTLPGFAPATDANQNDYSGLSLPGVVFDWTYSPAKGLWSGFGNALSALFGEISLGSLWFDHLVHPRPEAWMLGDVLAAYSSGLPDRKSNTASMRAGDIVSYLQDYDAKVASTPEKPILSLTFNDSEDQLQIGGDKLMLFFYALEDKCGSGNLNHALAHMVSALRFQQYGYDDFRSAVEQECHQDLGPFFRSWLNEKGIPADFRAKYGAASEKKN